MGNLLRVLQDKHLGPKVDFYVDFERAEPTEGEKEVYQQVRGGICTVYLVQGLMTNLYSIPSVGNSDKW